MKSEISGLQLFKKRLNRWDTIALLLLLFPMILTAADPSPADSQTALIENDPSIPLGNKIPLLLIHGLHGNQRAYTESDRIENPNDQYFAKLLAYFYSIRNNSGANPGRDILEQYKIYRFHYVCDVGNSVKDIAKALRNKLDALTDSHPIELGSRQFAIVAHSMGGLVARSYMEEWTHLSTSAPQFLNQKCGNRVSQLITLATPHRGTPGANAVARFNNQSLGFQELLLILDGYVWYKRDTQLHPGSTKGLSSQIVGYFTSVSEYNRKDLTWEYYSLSNEVNSWLTALNVNSVFNAKIKAYYGGINASTSNTYAIVQDLGNIALLQFFKLNGGDDDLSLHNAAAAAAVVIHKIYSAFDNDGLVSQNSASFVGGGIVTENRHEFVGYDHLDMKDGKPSDPTRLFDQIYHDLVLGNPPSDTAHIDTVTAPSFVGPSIALTIKGSGFQTNSTLLFNQSPNLRAITVDSANQMRYTANLPAGTYGVKVLNNGIPSNAINITVSSPIAATSPPPAPQLSVMPSQWTNKNIFAIFLNANPDSTGISKIWYKLKSPPLSNSDAGAFVLNGVEVNSFFVASDISGPATVYVWLENGAGQQDYRNNTQIQLRYDPVPPNLFILSPTPNPIYNSTANTVTLGGSVDDGFSGVSSITWAIKGGTPGIAARNGNTWSIPQLPLSPGATDITVTATDNAGNATSRYITVTYSAVAANKAPNQPTNPSPVNGQTNVVMSQPSFSWTGGDPDADTVQYLFRFGLDPNPGAYSTWQTGTSFQYLGTLYPEAVYYWSVRARDSNGAITDGPVWSFTTQYAYADLAASGLTITGTVQPGGQVALGLTITNLGNFSSPSSYVHYYLSRTKGAKEIRLTPNLPEQVLPLNPGGQQTVSFNAVLTGLGSGQSFIDAYIDSGLPGPFNEQDFTNNLFSIPITYTDNQKPTVTYLALFNPNIMTANTAQINYAATDDVGVTSLDFYYSADNGTTWTTIQQGYVPPKDPTNTVSYMWLVPVNVPITTNLVLKAIAKDAANNVSDARTAGPYPVINGEKPVVTVTSPNGGEIYGMGTVQTVRWNLSSPNPIATLAVWLYHDGAAELLGRMTPPTSNTFQWSIRSPFSTTSALIKVEAQDVNGNEGFDYSDAYFTVRDTSAPPPAPWNIPIPLTNLTPNNLSGDIKENLTPRLAVDASGNVHAAYIYHEELGHIDNAGGYTKDTINYTIFYRKRTGGVWSAPSTISAAMQSADTAVFFGLTGLDIAVDSSGRPHVTWCTLYNQGIPESNHNDVFYAYWNGASWVMPVNLSNGITGSIGARTLSWGAKKAFPKAISGTAAASFNGKLYVMGGHPFLATNVYDPSNDTWTARADMSGGGISAGNATVVGSKIYAFGNRIDSKMRIYDPTADAWTEGSNASIRRTGCCVVTVLGKVYVIGSEDASSEKVNEVYDPGSGNWSRVTDMPTGRGYAAAGVINNKIYVIGGRGSGGANTAIEVYDPSNDTWSTITKPVVGKWPVLNECVACTVNGRIYICGGNSTRDVYEFDPSTNSFFLMSPMASKRNSACGAAIGSQIFIVGGYQAEVNQSAIEIASMESAQVVAGQCGTNSVGSQVAIGSGDLAHVVWRDGTNWQPNSAEPIFNFSSVGQSNLYRRGGSVGQSWSAPSQITTAGGSVAALCAGSDGSIHAAHFSLSNIGYMKATGNSWSTPVVTQESDFDAIKVGIGFDGSTAHVIGKKYDSVVQKSRILYGKYLPSGWSPFEAVYTANSANYPSVVLDSHKRPHIIFHDESSSNKLVYLFKDNTQWSTPLQIHYDSTRPDSLSSDVAISQADEMHVVWAALYNGHSEIFYNHANVGATTDTFLPSVSVLAPTLGDIIPVHAPFSIHWDARDNLGVTGVDLYYSTDGGTSFPNTIASNVSNTGSFSWTTPATVSTSLQVKVVAHDAAGNSNAGYSGTFTTADISPPAVSVVSPLGGATILGNSIIEISWSATDNVGVTRIDLECSIDNGASWSTLGDNIAVAAPFSWTVSNTPTTTLLVRVTATDAAQLHTTTVEGPITIKRANNPPSVPFSPTPISGVTGLDIVPITISWNCIDVDDDALMFDVYFGTSVNPPKIGTFAAKQFVTPALLPNTTYYFKVVASDGKNTTSGPVWSFSTYTTPAIAIGAVLPDGILLEQYAQPLLVSGGVAPYSWLLTGGALPTGISLDGAGALTGVPTLRGSHSFTLKVTDSNNQSAIQTFSLTIIGKAPTVTWSNPADIVYGTSLDVMQLNATASILGTFSYAPSIGTKLNAGDNQMLSVDFTPHDTVNYDSVFATVSINVTKAPQTIMFSPIADQTGNSTFQLNANASSGLTVAFSVVSGPVSLLGTSVTPTAVGQATIRASQIGDNNYVAAPTVDQSFSITDPNHQFDQAPIFESSPLGLPNPATVGELVQFFASATSALPITYVWDFGDGTFGSGSSVNHVFSVAKIYIVTVTATNTANLSAIATVVIQMNVATSGVAVLPGEVDSDGDGFSDNVEAKLGTNAFDPKDSPSGGGAPIVQALATNSAKISKKRVLALTGTLSIPAGFTTVGKALITDIGGFAQIFQLNSKGAGKTGKDTFKITIKAKKGVVAAQLAKFALKLNNVPSTVDAASRSQFIIGGIVFSTKPR